MWKETKLDQENEADTKQAGKKKKTGRKKYKSPYYYIVNNKCCFVNTHNGGEVFL